MPVRQVELSDTPTARRRFAKRVARASKSCVVDETVLASSNLSAVVRTGNTVRRSVGPWSPTVHDLLQHLEQHGFDGAPCFLGMDEQGREVLTFLPGDTGFVPYLYTDEELVGAAHLLRRYHDVTTDFAAPAGAIWQTDRFGSDRGEVVCHNDFAPYNLVFQDEFPSALIDSDPCGPGPKLWDVAFSAHWFVPLSFGATDLKDVYSAGLLAGSSRLRKFCAAYGVDAGTHLLDMLEQRLQYPCDWLYDHASTGDVAYQEMMDEGHLEHYRRELETLWEQRPRLARREPTKSLKARIPLV